MITIDEAIEANEDTVELLTEKGLIRKAKAVQLGIEALKFKKTWLKGRFYPSDYLLPGETKE